MNAVGLVMPKAETPERGSKNSTGLTREQVVDRIITINPTATKDFLDTFNASHLGGYLDHLVAAQRPRGPDSRWSRPNDSPAIMVRVSAR